MRKISPELGNKTVLFSHKIKTAFQTRLFKGLEVRVDHYISWFVPQTCFKFQFFSKIVGWLYVPSEGHITTHKISPELGPKTAAVFFTQNRNCNSDPRGEGFRRKNLALYSVICSRISFKF